MDEGKEVGDEFHWECIRIVGGERWENQSGA